MSDRHGTISGYTEDKCSCNECRAAMAAYKKEWRKKRLAQAAAGEVEIIEHGQNAYSNYGCRCEVCCAAQLERSRRERKNRPKKRLAEHETRAYQVRQEGFRRITELIRAYTNIFGYGPTLTELIKGLGMPKNTIRQYIDLLAKDGRVIKPGMGSRDGYRLSDRKEKRGG